MRLPRSAGSRWSLVTVIDGCALAVLLVAIFTAEAFDAARDDIQSVAEHRGRAAAVAATPDWLASRWTWLLSGAALVGLYVTIRFVVIARSLQHEDEPKRLRALRRTTPLFAVLALGAWLWWQRRAIDVVEGSYAVAADELLGLRIGAALLALIALGLGGAAVGAATLATRRGSLVRLQWLFLLVLFLLFYYPSFVSDQLTDVLRGWGDGPGSRVVSRPLAGLAAAVLLGAVVRASASRILLPPPTGSRHGSQLGAARAGAALAARVALPRRYLVGALVVAGVALVVLRVFAALVIGAGIVVGLAAWSRPAAPRPDPGEPGVRGLRRLAGTMGVVPLAILLGGLTAASVNSLLLPSGPSTTDVRLFICTGVVAVAFGLLSAHAHVVVDRSFDRDDRARGEVFGALGFLFAALSVISTTLAAVLLACLAFVLAFRRYGERGAIELWSAWGAGLGLALAVYCRPVDVPGGLGGIAVALLGATIILALLHPVASLGSRYAVRLWRWWRTPVLIATGVWLALAWLFAPHMRNQVPSVDAAKPPEPLATAVGTWLEDMTQNPPDEERPYLPMLLVAASGGGSKAAYWTDLVLDCMLGGELTDADKDECPASDAAGDRYRSLFLTSSASGGSVGIYQLIRHREAVAGGQPWIAASTGKEVLSPLLAWGLFHDLPAFLIGAPTRPGWCDGWLSCRINADRAADQAAAVAGEDDPADVRTGGDALTAQTGPITIFNTAQVGRLDPGPFWPRRRVVFSRVSLAEPEMRSACPEAAAQAIDDAIDGHDLLASGEDVTTLSSALLSARFPILEPPGWVGTRSRGSDRACGGEPPTEPSAKIRDGGTYENTGMLSLVDLLDQIRAAIERWERDNHAVDVRMIVVSIDDDVPAIEGDEEYDLLGSDPDDPAGRARAARKRACEQPGVGYVRISPQPHVGAQAATGWELSETSRQEDLVDSLRPTAGPGKRLEQVRAMLDGTPLEQSCLN